MYDFARSRSLNNKKVLSGPVVCWLQRDQRAVDNWALIHAGRLAREYNRCLLAVFCLQDGFLSASSSHYRFMLDGLMETYTELSKQQIPLIILRGNPEQSIAAFVNGCKAAVLVTDFSPLRIVRNWKNLLADAVDCLMLEVDAHNIIPCWLASDKQEYAARTFRPKAQRHLDSWLIEYPEPLTAGPLQSSLMSSLQKLSFQSEASEDYSKIKEMALTDTGFAAGLIYQDYAEGIRILKDERAALQPNPYYPAAGYQAGMERLVDFIVNDLTEYGKRNDPNAQAVSELSPYLHFGMISAQQAALKVREAAAGQPELAAAATEFLEELIVRRELSDNYCFYNPNYDNNSGFPEWAARTLNSHRHDLRPYLYPLTILEAAKTHDPLWNAAMSSIIKTGRLAGYLRMYWAKKLLEWTENPDQAQEFAIYLNDKYLLDGRDPNGYTGIAWSIGGVHDRPWADRQVFGQIRLMTYSGCLRKFDVGKYIKYIGSL